MLFNLKKIGLFWTIYPDLAAYDLFVILGGEIDLVASKNYQFSSSKGKKYRY